jgi:hypothetical protein
MFVDVNQDGGGTLLPSTGFAVGGRVFWACSRRGHSLRFDDAGAPTREKEVGGSQAHHRGNPPEIEQNDQIG